MVTVSDAAAAKTKEILEAEGKGDCGLRFTTAGSSCCGPSYSIDIVEKPGDGDEIIEKNGARFYIEQTTLASIKGMEIDFVDDGQRQGFVFTGGQAPSCGSGGCSSC
ncbi:MAG: iron-sulfur cluster assembly accessory protein [Nitrospiraceae bacterium]|nr:MAG: iron-sulfur cluster assembly accessory protein [Nitrospiraceae bacterium]UCH45145.1 MAG: iron-sulfur cluster assembly accessory protein [Nitrospiraceae bacterium]